MKGKTILCQKPTGVGYKGITEFNTGVFYAPYIPRFMTKPDDIVIKNGYRGEFVIEVPWHLYPQMIKWCLITFGEDGRNPRYRWRRNMIDNHRIFLKHQSDLMIFRLKWSEQIARG